MIYTALGAGANVRERKIGALCSSPVEVAIQQTFSIFDAYNEGPPLGAQDVNIKTLTQLFRAFVRLLSCFPVVLQYLSCAQRGRGIFHPP